jgi:hypothetical protein
MKTQVILDWVRANVFTVVFIVVMIAALVAFPLVAGWLGDEIEQDVRARKAKLRELEQLEKTNVTIERPGRDDIRETVLVNRRLLDEYRDLTEARREDAQRVLTAAEEHNRKERGVLMSRLFPDPPAAEAEVLPKQFHSRIHEAHEELLEEIGAGTPPRPKALEAELERQRSQFLTQTLQKTDMASLTDDEKRRLREKLSKVRLSKYVEAADSIGVYVDKSALNLPAWDQARSYPMTELFDWQWQYWINQDILYAVADANAGSGGAVVRAPVKRVLDILVHPMTAARGKHSTGGSGTSGGGGSGFGMGSAAGGPSGGGGRGGETAAPPAIPPDPQKEVPLNYDVSFTGRTSNPLYDVRIVDIQLIVDTARIPELIDALSSQNFMTVLDLKMQPADPHDALQSGFVYAPGPVSRVSLRLETIWLRSWTSQFMPREVRVALGVPVEPSVSLR